jgi:hypothetical protein
VRVFSCACPRLLNPDKQRDGVGEKTRIGVRLGGLWCAAAGMVSPEKFSMSPCRASVHLPILQTGERRDRLHPIDRYSLFPVPYSLAPERNSAPGDARRRPMEPRNPKAGQRPSVM